MNTNIHVNVNEIPPEVAERIGCVFLGFHKRFQQSPELMAELEAYRAIKAARVRLPHEQSKFRHTAAARQRPAAGYHTRVCCTVGRCLYAAVRLYPRSARRV